MSFSRIWESSLWMESSMKKAEQQSCKFRNHCTVWGRAPWSPSPWSPSGLLHSHSLSFASVQPSLDLPPLIATASNKVFLYYRHCPGPVCSDGALDDILDQEKKKKKKLKQSESDLIQGYCNRSDKSELHFTETKSGNLFKAGVSE